jgi:hypothetical protein
MAVDIAPLLDFGCLAGVPSRFAAPAAAAAWLDDGRSRLRADRVADPECVEAWEDFSKTKWGDLVATQPGESAARVVYGGLVGWYARLEGQLCAVPARAGAP